MQVGDKISTPRFLTVTIEKVLTREEAALLGFTEPTHYRGEYDILGRQVGPNLMEFAAVKKDSPATSLSVAGVLLAAGRRRYYNAVRDFRHDQGNN